MNNVAPFSRADLLACFGNVGNNLPADLSCIGVSTDTRTLVQGNIFVALRGEHFDGHNHVSEAEKSGARLIIAEEPVNTLNAAVLVVESTLHALGTLAWYHRKRFQLPVIAIGGSAGKTSTKELVAHVLSEVYSVLFTQANYNNRIGTPLTLLQLNSSHTAAVIEIGTNEPGEIELLSAMVQPTHGLITQIGKEHLEKLIDLDGVEREETALFDFLRDHDGVPLVNADDDRLHTWYQRHGGRGLSFGTTQPADLQVQLSFDEDLHPVLHAVTPDGGLRALLQTTGLAAGLNGVAAYAVAKAVGMDLPSIRRGLQSYKPKEGHGYARMVVQHHNGKTILNDTYNANPESMLMALRTLEAYNQPYRVAVLGDMRELGTAAAAEHADVLDKAVAIADTVVVLGQEFARAAIHHPSVHVCQTHRQCATIINNLDKQGIVVLIKGSRGLAMEQVITDLGEV